MAEMRQSDVQAMLRSMVEPSGSARAWAAKRGLSGSYVSQVIKGTRPPSDELCKAMGIKPDGMRWVSVNGASAKPRKPKGKPRAKACSSANDDEILARVMAQRGGDIRK